MTTNPIITLTKIKGITPAQAIGGNLAQQLLQQVSELKIELEAIRQQNSFRL